MKKNTSLFLLSLTLVFSMLLSGCGQSQNSVPPAENGSTASTPTVDTSTPANEPEVPEDSQPVITEPPAETDPSTEEPDASADEPDEETPDAIVNAPETNVPTPEESAPVSTPEAGQTTDPATPSETNTPSVTNPASNTQEPASTQETPPVVETVPADTPASSTALSGINLTLRFGGGEEFAIHMYDNDTANKIAEYVGTASWQLPIYHFDDYDGWESFQYYDIPSRYDIPDGAQSVTSEKAGAVYYSHPNRIILFYQDANISTEYTPVGYVDFSQDLVDAVENNPVVQGWGNKLVFIQP